jgi:DNA-binding transcriptional ArsR family regulator
LTVPIGAITLADPSGKKLLEVQPNGQTVVPPSVHESGEEYIWYKDEGATSIDPETFIQKVHAVGAAALLAQNWPPEGGRHDAAMALAGGLYALGMPLDQARDFVDTVVFAADDDEEEDRTRAVEDTFEKAESGKPTKGWSSLKKLMNAEAVVRVQEWLAKVGKAGENDNGHTPTFRLASEVKMRSVWWLWPRYILRGYLNLVEGDSGEGKSTMLLDLVARITTGRKMPDGSAPNLDDSEGTVIIYNAEDGAEDVTVPRLTAAGADLAKVILPDDFLTLPDGVAGLESLIRETGAVLVILDPLVAFLSDSSDTHKDHSVRRVLAGLQHVAEKTGVAIVLIRHFGKGQDKSRKHRGNGSVGFVAAARSVIHIDPAPGDSELKLVRVVKGNLTEKGDDVGYRLDSIKVAGIDGSASVVHWLTPSPSKIRDRIMSLVHQTPGITRQQLAAKTGLSLTTVNHHLKGLGDQIKTARNGKADGIYPTDLTTN